MWRWVTRGLVLTCASLFAHARSLSHSRPDSSAALDLPDPTVTSRASSSSRASPTSRSISSQDRALRRRSVQYQRQHRDLPRIDIVEAYPNYPGIQQHRARLPDRLPRQPLLERAAHGLGEGLLRRRPVIELGRRTINIDNTLNQSPFGILDIPDPARHVQRHAARSRSSAGPPTPTASRKSTSTSTTDPAVGDVRRPASRCRQYLPRLPGRALQRLHREHRHDPHPGRRAPPRSRAPPTRSGLSKPHRPRGRSRSSTPRRTSSRSATSTSRSATRCCTARSAAQVPASVSPPVNPQSHITPVRGWALDLGTRTDTGRVSYVELLIDGVRWCIDRRLRLQSDLQTSTRTATACRVSTWSATTRTIPTAPRSGYMFTLDVGALVALGVRPGNHVLKVRVGDQQQTFTELPNRDGIPVFFECAEEPRRRRPSASSTAAHLRLHEGHRDVPGVGGRGAPVAAVEIIVDGECARDWRS